MGTMAHPVSRAKHIASLLVPSTAITLPSGFRFAGIAAGIKKKIPQQLDLALIHSSKPCTVAAAFTTNLFQASPVRISKQILLGTAPIHSVIINSGCANACTGHQGDLDAQRMSDLTSDLVMPGTGTLVMSTGVIGERLNMLVVEAGIHRVVSELGASGDHVLNAAHAILTTDTFPKYLSKSVRLPDSRREYTMLGLCKGSGMIHPKMKTATMLSVVTTDLGLDQAHARDLVDESVATSFNSVTVDGDTSTNDSIYMLANGSHQVYSARDQDVIRTEMAAFCRSLASTLVWDGEGATKFITVQVKSHCTDVSEKIACSVATSNLVKTAMYGQDANWGRVLCAVGYTDVDRSLLNPDLVSLAMANSFGDSVQLVSRGVPNLPIDETLCAAILKDDRLFLHVDMGTGACVAEYDFCDLSHQYISINADYRS